MKWELFYESIGPTLFFVTKRWCCRNDDQGSRSIHSGPFLSNRLDGLCIRLASLFFLYHKGNWLTSRIQTPCLWKWSAHQIHSRIFSLPMPCSIQNLNLSINKALEKLRGFQITIQCKWEIYQLFHLSQNAWNAMETVPWHSSLIFKWT